MQRCAFGYEAAAAKDGLLVRQTTGAKVLSDEVLVCPSFLAREAGTAPFSVSLNGVDFIADATAQANPDPSPSPTPDPYRNPTPDPNPNSNPNHRADAVQVLRAARLPRRP